MAQTTLVFDAETVQGSNTANGKPDEMSKDGITISCTDAAFKAYNKGTSSYEYRFYKNSTTTITSTVGNIQKIVFTCTAIGKAKQGPGCLEDFTTGTYTFEEDGKTGTWTGDASTIEFSCPTNQARATKIEVTIAAGSSTKKSAGLEFSATSATATLGEAFTAPTLSNPNNLTVAYSSSDEGVATVNATTGDVTIVAAGTTTIKATSEATDEYDAGSASYTLTVSAPLSTVDNIAAFKALDANTKATLKLTNAQVLYVGSSDMYVRDATGAIDFYKSGLTYTQNQVLNGTLDGTYKDYYSTPELTDPENVNLTATDGAEAKPVALSATELTADHYCDLVKVEGVYDANAKTLDGVALYDKFKTGALDDITDGGRAAVTGILVPFKSAAEILIISAEDVASTKKEAGLAFAADTVKVTLGETFTAPALTNPNNLTVTYSSSNADVATVGATTGAVTIVAAGTTKISVASEETDVYYAGNAAYTLIVSKPSTVIDNIADFKEIGKKNSATLKLNNAQVLYVGSNDMYVRDATGAIDFYKTGLTYTQNQVLNGTLDGTYDEFNGTPELTSPKNVNVTATDGAAAEPVALAATALTAEYYCDLVKVEGTYSADAKTLDGVALYDKFKNGALDDLTDGTRYAVTGILVPFKNAPEILIISAEEVTSTKKEAGLAFASDTVRVMLGDEFTAPALTNPNNLTVAYTSSNPDVATVDATTGAVTIVAAGTTKISAASEETADFYAGNAAYTLIVEKAYTNIADFKTVGAKNSGKLSLTDAQVLYVNKYTTKNGKENTELYVRDATGAIEFFNAGVDFAAGQVLNGSCTATYDEFNGMPEITKIENSTLTATDGTVSPTMKGNETLTAADYCDLVTVTGTYDSAAKTLNGVPCYDKFKTGALDNLTDGDYAMTAIVLCYKGAPELAPVSAPVLTSINEVNTDVNAANGNIYNLAGQKVNASYKGIVIVNGKKVLRK